MNLANVNKKLFKYMFIVIGAFVGLMLIIGIVKLIVGNKLSYAKIEDKMQKATVEYLNDKDTELSLPTGNEVVNVDVEDLVANKNMKELSKYIKDKNVTCTGNVVVRKQNDEYLYIPHLDCGDAYKTISLKDYIIDKQGVVTDGDGLYYLNNEYTYRGEYVNNYVTFAGQTWRILKIDIDGNIKLLQDETKLKRTWDNRYNVEAKSSVGINNYELSRINKTLNDLYDEIFTDDDKKYITSKYLCVGRRFIGDTTKDGQTECAEILENQKIGLIQIDEYLRVSLDSNCTKIREGACQNYNYLSKYTDAWWSITPNAVDTHSVYEIYSGIATSSNASLSKLVRASIYLNNDVIYVSGDGSKENPYIFK